MKYSKKKKKVGDDFAENILQDEVIKLQEAYKFVERREVTGFCFYCFFGNIELFWGFLENF